MELKTNRGVIFLIDDEDYHLVKDIKWNQSSKGYIRGYCRVAKRQIILHRLVMDVWKKSIPIIDHINRIKTDNRKCNLRFCTQSENQKNITPRGKSKYLGVSIHTTFVDYKTKSGVVKTYKYASFRSSISANGKWMCLGKFKNEIDAAKAYNEAAIKYHGEFANLNIFE